MAQARGALPLSPCVHERPELTLKIVVPKLAAVGWALAFALALAGLVECLLSVAGEGWIEALIEPLI